MTRAEEFIDTLHAIAAANGHTATVDQVFERFLAELRQAVGSDQQRIRRNVEDLQNALAAEATQPRTGAFADLRDHARALVASWLRTP